MITKVDDVNKDSDFYKCMYGICIDDAQADEVVKLLEGISSDAPMPYSREFCISYVIKLLEKYCSADECELALARYGFLDGFERKKYKQMGKRTEEYWKYARRYNQHEFISSDWTTTGTALTKLKDHHMIIVGNLDVETSRIKSENNNKLGLIEEVPKELKFPKPRKIENITSTPEDGDISQTVPENKTESSQQHIPKKWIEQLIAAGAFGAILACGLIFMLQFLYSAKANVNTEEVPIVKEIYVFNNKFDLPVGEKETLDIAPSPPDADRNSIKCISENPELVWIENDYDVRAQGSEEWQDETEHTAIIYVQGGRAEKFPVEVTVINPGIYADRVKDRLPNSEN